MLRFILSSLLFITMLSNSLFSQADSNRLDLKGRHSISMSMGMRTNSDGTIIRTSSLLSSWDRNNVDVKTGFMGAFAYSYWFDDEWSVNFQVGIISANVDVKGISQSTLEDYTNVSSNTITPVLMGFKYYPKFLSMGNVGRAYGGLNVGSFVGTSSKTSYWIMNETTIESVFGAEANVGVDLFIAKWLRIGPCLSYNVHTKFTSANINNDNAFGFMVNTGVVF